VLMVGKKTVAPIARRMTIERMMSHIY
jgi:hypothetical protein